MSSRVVAAIFVLLSSLALIGGEQCPDEKAALVGCLAAKRTCRLLGLCQQHNLENYLDYTDGCSGLQTIAFLRKPRPASLTAELGVRSSRITTFDASH
jgi:hypothetical protein